MKFASILALAIVTTMFVACTSTSSPGQSATTDGRQRLAQGIVTQLDNVHGNVYTSILASQYESLGLVPGQTLHIDFPDTTVTLVAAVDYADVPSGAPVAVLHREGLTFAIRDGNFTSTYDVTAGAPFTVSTDAKR